MRKQLPSRRTEGKEGRGEFAFHAGFRRAPGAGHRAREAFGFTLIELLVVVAVVTILLAMLMPALNNAQRAARRARCASNLKQLAVWGLAYASDNSGILPTHSYVGVGSEDLWSDISSTMWFVKAGAPYQLYKGFNSTDTAMNCPEAMDGYTLRNPSYGNTYGINAFVGGRKEWGGNGTAPLPTIHILKAQTFWFCDARAYESPSGGGTYDFHPMLQFYNTTLEVWPWPWNSPQGHGNGTANFVFGDGHVEAVTLDKYNNFSAEQRKTFQGNPF